MATIQFRHGETAVRAMTEELRDLGRVPQPAPDPAANVARSCGACGGAMTGRHPLAKVCLDCSAGKKVVFGRNRGYHRKV